MRYKIPLTEFPEEVEISSRLTPEEKDKPIEEGETRHKHTIDEVGPSFHEKSAKNQKENAKVKSYHRKLKEKYKKPQKRGDKIQNKKSRKKK